MAQPNILEFSDRLCLLVSQKKTLTRLLVVDLMTIYALNADQRLLWTRLHHKAIKKLSGDHKPVAEEKYTEMVIFDTDVLLRKLSMGEVSD
jgi:hypothetical protein